MTARPLRLGIIGAGAAVRKLHWPVLKEISDQVRILAVANRSRASAETFALNVGARVYDSHQELLQSTDVEVVLLAVPIFETATLLRDAIGCGKHVMVEKPLAASSREALEIVKAAQQCGRVIAVAENFRYRQDILKARELIQSGEIGRVISFQVTTKFDRNAEIRRDWFERPWRKSPSHPGGILLDAGVHAVAGLRDVLGDVTSLFAQIPDRDSETGEPGSLLMQLTLGSGAVGQYYACYQAKVPSETIFDLSVIGERGSLQLKEGEVAWTNEQGSHSQRFASPGFDRGYRGQWRNFLAAIQGEEALESTVAKAYEDLRVIEAGLLSAQTFSIIRMSDLH